MAQPLAKLRIELEADSASLEQGLAKAGSAMQRFAAIGVAVGNVIANAFIALAQRAIGALSDLTDVTSEAFQRMNINGQRAGLALGQAFDRVAQRGAEFAAELANRVLPGVAHLAEQMAGIPGVAMAASIALEALVFSFKLLVTGGALVVGVVEAILHIIGSAAQALLAFATGNFREAYQHIQQGAQSVADSVRETAATIRNIWAETQVTPGPGVLGPWTTMVQRAEVDTARMRELRDEMNALFADPTTSEVDRIAAAQVAHQEGAINIIRFEEAKRKAYLATQQAMENSFSAVGRALTAVFSKSKPAAIAQALINTYVGITQALRSGPSPWNLVQAAAVGAMGFAQVRSITSTSESGGGAPSMSTGGAAAAAATPPSQMLTVEGLSGDGLMSMLSVRGLIERINDATANGATLVLR